MEGDSKEKTETPEESAVSPTTTMEEDEEAQMTKFFALLKNVKEMQEQLRRRVDDRRTKRLKVDRPAWTPTFQWGDFAAVPEAAGQAERPAAATQTASVVTEDEETGEKKEETHRSGN